ncbi:MAG: TIGR01440 family protein [Alicyclobacillaceae bacterium]|nr:TIGR01440 family protein [Alicyclobacillaceae bacterium]
MSELLKEPVPPERLEEIRRAVRRAAAELAERAGLDGSRLLVVGASTSEIAGRPIGSAGSLEIGEAVVEALLELRRERRVHLAIQGCEHINRALVVERETLERFGLEEVSVVPVPEAGGAAAAAAFRMMDDPVCVEAVRAHAGLDIGDTLIGMHLRPVAVPVRLSANRVGEARVVAARTRPKYVGGPRARYALEPEDAAPKPGRREDSSEPFATHRPGSGRCD